MSAPHNWLKAAIEQATGVAAWPCIVGGGSSTPYVLYERTSTTKNQTLRSVPGVGPVPTSAEFAVYVYSGSYTQAWEIASAITNAIDTFQGTAFGETIGHCLVVDGKDEPAEFDEGNDKPTFVVHLTVQILIQE